MSTRKPRPQPIWSRPPTWRIEYHVRLWLYHSIQCFIQKSLLQRHCLSWNLSSTWIWQHRLLLWYTNRPLYPKPGVGRGESDLLAPAIIPWITGTEPPDSLSCCFLLPTSAACCSHLHPKQQDLCIRMVMDHFHLNPWRRNQFIWIRTFNLFCSFTESIITIKSLLWHDGECGEGVRSSGWIVSGDRQWYEGTSTALLIQIFSKKDGCVLLPLFSSGVQLPAPLMLWLMAWGSQHGGLCCEMRIGPFCRC